MSINLLVYDGRFTKDPELQTSKSGISILNFCLAQDKPHQKDKENHDTNFLDCTAFGTTAETIEKCFAKGNRILLQGRIDTSSYHDKDGNNRKSVKMIVDRFEFVESSNKSEDEPSNEDRSSHVAKATTKSSTKHTEEPDKDECGNDLPW